MKALHIFAAAGLIALSCRGQVQAQLAITEVMAESSTNSLPAFKGPDFWELTNFGTNDIHLDGYGFSDNNVATVYTYPFSNLVIRASESIIFCRTNVPDANTIEKFKAWWGEQNLPPDLQVRFYARPGFDGSAGDEVWLRDPATNVVDMVAFGASVPGRTLAYDRETGAFGAPSVAGAHAAFRAIMNTNDVGSPGFTAGPVPLSILQQPTSQTVDACGSATFIVSAGGLPRPKYQWTSNGIPIAGATGPRLVISDVQPSSAGEYRVMLNNGVMELMSAPALLTVNTNPLAPAIIHPPQDTTVFPGQTALFFVEARGFPCLQYQWKSNGVAMADETNRTLSVAVPTGSPLRTTIYSVTVRNDSGSTNASAVLTVVRRPCLSITELMSSPTNGPILRHLNWFELTNCDTNAVDLRGYRFRDAPSLVIASIITNAVVIKPGESVIFVEAMRSEEFIRWWGAENLPPGLQIITWYSWGLDASGADVIHIWNSGATDPLDEVANASHLAAIPGMSEELENFCDPLYGCTGFYLRDSVAGENGAFRAVEGGDIGSPGYTANPPPRLLGLSRDALRVNLRCRVVEGKTYQLSWKNALADAVWTPLPSATATGSIITMEDTNAGSALLRFYRLEELP